MRVSISVILDGVSLKADTQELVGKIRELVEEGTEFSSVEAKLEWLIPTQEDVERAQRQQREEEVAEDNEPFPGPVSPPKGEGS